MAEEQDARVTAAYRELGAEEPPRALDAAILAAARRPARPWTQRYAVPIGLAAVLVLSVTVTLRIQHERPGIESIARQEPAASAPAAAPEAALKLKPEMQIKPTEPARQRAAKAEAQDLPKPFADARVEARREQAAAPKAPPPASADLLASPADMGRGTELSSRGMAERQAEDRTARDAEAAARAHPRAHQAGALLAKRRSDQPAPAAASAPAPAVASVAPAAAPPAAKPAAEPPAKVAEQAAKVPADTPEREFERIAQLRAEGRHDEADKAFLEFRRRYPGFRITEEMLRRIERR
jgi:hypothetical protein